MTGLFGVVVGVVEAGIAPVRPWRLACRQSLARLARHVPVPPVCPVERLVRDDNAAAERAQSHWNTGTHVDGFPARSDDRGGRTD